MPDKAFGARRLPAFIQRYVSDRPAFEPQIGFAPDGAAYFPSAIYRQGPYPGTEEPFRLFRSRDKGLQWEDITQDLPAIGLAQNQGGGDPITHLDVDTGRLFFGVYSGGCTLLHWTDDRGQAWDFARVCDDGPGTDKPAVFTGPPAAGVTTTGYENVIYLCYNGLLTVRCKRSLDGGTIWTSTALPFPQNLGPSGHTIGFGAASRTDGTIYLPRSTAGKAWVAVSQDSGNSWQQTAVGTGIDRPFSANHGQIVTDIAGNAYYFWLGDNSLPTLAVSSDSGKTWTAPRVVAVPGITAANNPAIAVGKPGQIAVFYVGSDVPGGYQASQEEMASALWHGYVGMSLDVFAENPVLATTAVNAPADPLKKGPCADRCYEYQWNGCASNPPSCASVTTNNGVPEGMYDYAGLVSSPTDGRVWASFVDLCLDACPQPIPDSEGWSSRGSVAVQIRGPRLFTHATKN